jgi:hypothetical protein
MFGDGRPVPLDRNAKVRIKVKAMAHMHATEKGKHYGAITAKYFKVLETLLWDRHNSKTGLCIRTDDVWVLTAPRVPGLRALLEYRDVLVVGHREHPGA